ncbi:MAG: hypothetical protein OXJ52_01925 [Oligoflexia bacterium]|nr:hypothetical protein [Oligoflexia bacterium]
MAPQKILFSALYRSGLNFEVCSGDSRLCRNDCDTKFLDKISITIEKHSIFFKENFGNYIFNFA